MAKYSEELKLKVVNYYLNNYYIWKYVAKEFNITAWRTVRKYEEDRRKKKFKHTNIIKYFYIVK